MSNVEINLFKIALGIQILTFLSPLVNIPSLRVAIGLLFLSFVPGFFILQILKIKTSLLETTLFSIGLSIAFAMFFGLLLNITLPIFNYSTPLSTFSLIIAVATVTLVLCILALFRGNLNSKYSIEFKFSPLTILLILLPFAAIIGAQILNSYGNTLLLALFLVTGVVMLCCVSKRVVPTQSYPLVIFSISLFLLFSTVFSSNYLIGWDVHSEYYFAHLTSVNGFWDRTIIHSYNGMLSVTILPAVYTNFLNMNLDSFFRLFFPILLALVPIALYLAYKKKTGSTIALLGIFFFISIQTFYVQMLGLSREIVAELFFALIILLMFEDKISLRNRRLLFVFFSAALVVSHYSLSYIFLIFLLVSPIITYFFKRKIEKQDNFISKKMILFYGLFVCFWSVYVFPFLGQSAYEVLVGIYSNLMDVSVSSGIGNAVATPNSFIHTLSQGVFFGLQFLVLLGVLIEMIKFRRMNFNPQYLSLAIASSVMLIISTILPAAANSINMSRVYQIALFILAPFCILGARSIAGIFNGLHLRLTHSGKKANPIFKKLAILLMFLVLVIYLLFQSGFIYEVVHDNQVTSSVLSRDSISSWAPYLQQLYVDEPEALGAKWLSNYTSNQSTVYADYQDLQVTSCGLVDPNKTVPYSFTPENLQYAPLGSVVYLGRENTVNGKLIVTLSGQAANLTDYTAILNSIDKCYSSGDTEIYIKSGP